MDMVLDKPVAEPVFYDVDLFSPAALRAPYGHYRAMRDLGPVVRLRDPDVYVLSRFDEVRNALRASDVLYSADGVGFSDVFNKTGGASPNILQSDGALHSKLHKVVQVPLMPSQLRQHRQMLRDLIGGRIKSLVDRGPFDAMREIAPFLPVAAISELVGLPEEGRAAMLDWASANFNAVGPDRLEFAGDFALVKQARAYLTSVDREHVREGSWARMLLDAAVAGSLTEAEARGAMTAYVLPSLDTTILAKGHLLYDLASTPGQWEMLQRDPSLKTGAVLESVRRNAVVRWFSRVAREDYRVEDYVIPAGSRIMLIYASANRDERRYEDPDTFNILRDARAQLAWGTGAHMCSGLHLARIEMEVMLEALLEHCASITVGEPEIADNRGLYGFKTLQLELRSA